MKKPCLLDPKRADDPDVIGEYAADCEQFRQYANFAELDFLIRRAEEIERDLDIARSRKNRRHIRVLTSKLRGANATIKNWMAGYGDLAPRRIGEISMKLFLILLMIGASLYAAPATAQKSRMQAGRI